MVVFAADASHWYQDFTFWASFLTVVAGLASGAWFLARYFYQRQVVHLTADLEALRVERGTDRDKLERELQDSLATQESLRQDLSETRESAGQLQGAVDRL